MLLIIESEVFYIFLFNGVGDGVKKNFRGMLSNDICIRKIKVLIICKEWIS